MKKQTFEKLLLNGFGESPPVNVEVHDYESHEKQNSKGVFYIGS
jgi:hypothetical protein